MAQNEATKAQQDLLAVGQQIANHLPEGWTAAVPDGHDNGVYLHGPNNTQLHFNYILNPGDTDRYKITGSPTGEERGHSWRYSDKSEYPNGCKGITVTANKTPVRIAQDITSRLLPEYLPYLAVLRERVKAHNIHESQTLTLRDELLAAIGSAGQAHGGDGIYLKLKAGYGTLQVQSDGVYFQDLSIPRDLALEFAKLLAKDAG